MLCRASALTLWHLAERNPPALLPERVEARNYDVLDITHQSACGSDANIFA